MEEKIMGSLNIVKVDNFSFKEYKKLVDNYINKEDWNEIRYQNEVVKPFISAICPELCFARHSYTILQRKSTHLCA